MTLVLALFGAVLGGIIGGLVGFLAIVALGYATGAPTNDGGVEMGAALVGAPVGLVIGAILGCLLVLRLRKGKSRNAGPQAWVALGIVSAGLLGLYGWLFYEPPAPTNPNPVPQLISEIRVPFAEVDPQEYKNRTPYIWTYDNLVTSPNSQSLPAREGDEVVWRSTHDLHYDYPERVLYLWINRDRVLMFDLGLPGNPAPTPEFTEWRPPTHVRADTYGEDIPGPHPARIRFRIGAPTE